MSAFTSLLSLLQRFVSSWWARTISIGVLLTGLLWFYLPLLSIFAASRRRIIAILILWVVVIGIALLARHRQRREERSINATMTESDAPPDATAAGDTRSARHTPARTAAGHTEDMRELRKRLVAAIATLRKRGVRRLYDLPWYVLIGPPGSGKTTALRHSGLHFPLDEENEDALHGVGGTRLCDWWFADEAVLLDTAGRYTTQDSDRATDRAGWLGFLDALRKARPRQPINGVIVMISVLDIVGGSPELRSAHARQIRQRINELTDRLGVRIPVYLLFNKIDRLIGFDMFFDDLDATGRAQVWGMTFPLDGGAASFDSEFSLLLRQLDRRLIDRLQDERAPERRAILSGFPLQVASLAAPLSAFIETAFRDSRLDTAPFLRGVYLTSATQMGAPLDRLSGALARSFGIDQKRTGSANAVRGRAYFLSRLMREVVLAEAPLGAHAPGSYRRRRLARATALGAIGGLALCGVVFIWQGHLQARAMVTQQFARFAAYHDAVAPLAGRRISNDDDLPDLAAVLDRAHALVVPAPHGIAASLNLTPDDAARQAGRTLYENALTDLLYPRLIWRLEHEMMTHFTDPAALYDATRVYLLLGGAGPHDPHFVQAWFHTFWAHRYPGALNQPLRAKLDRHLAALVALPAPENTLMDGALVRRARIAFSHVTAAQRVYSRLRDQPLPSGVAEWSPASALGPVSGSVADTVFSRRSGAPLTEGVPGFYTGAGYARIMRTDLPRAARAVADESWVLGHETSLSVQGRDAYGLEQEVLALWARDAKAHWAAVLGDLKLNLDGTPGTVAGTLYLLSSSQSPLRDMIRSIVTAETIPMPDDKSDRKIDQKDGLPAVTVDNDPLEAIARQWNDGLVRIGGLLQAKSGSPPPIESIIALIGQLDTRLTSGTPLMSTEQRGAGGVPAPGQRLRAEASRQAEPVATWLREIADTGDRSRGAEVSAASSSAFNGQDGPGAACRALVTEHFPFAPTATQDAPLDGFVRLFGPGGLFDQYMQHAVFPFVDQSTSPWHLHDADGVHAPFTPAQLAAFERADAIKRAFFPAGGAPFVSLNVLFHPGSDMTMTLGTITVRPDQPTQLTWPGSDGLSPAQILRDRDGKKTTLEEANGPWALARLLKRGFSDDSIKGRTLYADGETLTVSGTSPAAHGSNDSPFSLLAQFTCPNVP